MSRWDFRTLLGQRQQRIKMHLRLFTYDDAETLAEYLRMHGCEVSVKRHIYKPPFRWRDIVDVPQTYLRDILLRVRRLFGRQERQEVDQGWVQTSPAPSVYEMLVRIAESGAAVYVGKAALDFLKNMMEQWMQSRRAGLVRKKVDIYGPDGKIVSTVILTPRKPH